MSIGDDISNLLRKIGPDAGIYQDLSQYNAARGGGQRRGLLGRAQSAPAPTPAAEAAAPVASNPAVPVDSSPTPATGGISIPSADILPTSSVESSTPNNEFLNALAGEIENPAITSPAEGVRPVSVPTEAGEISRASSATPVAAVLQGAQGWQLPASTLAAKTAATTGRPTSLSSLARRLNSETRSADEFDLSALGDASSEAPIELTARPTQRLDRLFDRLASSMPR